MVTLRREINRDTRRSDYRNNNNPRLYRDGNSDTAAREEDIRENRNNASPEYLQYLWTELDRTEPRRTLRPDEYMNEDSTSDRSSGIRRQDYSMAPKYERSLSPNNNARYSTRGRLDKKGVVAIVAYFLIVALIATLIIINGASASFDPATGSQAEVSVEAGAEVISTAELPLISEESLGVMISNDGSVVDINLLEKTSSYTYQAKTNWFDKVCDAISFIAGG